MQTPNIENPMEYLTAELNGEVLFYFPFKKSAFFADQKSADNLKAYLKHGSVIDSTEEEAIIKTIGQIRKKKTYRFRNDKSILNSRRVTVIPTESCNLACRYCYAKDSHVKQSMSLDQLIDIATYMFSKSDDRIGFSFIGGGEPFMCWDLICDFAEFCLKSDHKFHIHITTNGTLLDQKRIEQLCRYRMSISISYDILPEIQKHNRPFADGRSTVEIVESNIKALLDNGIVPPIRSTIMPEYVDRMGDMVEYVHQKFPSIKKLHFEQESSTGPDINPVYYEKFIDNFFIALEKAEKFGIKLTNSAVLSTEVLKDHFCKGELCFTPYGQIVSCHRISSPKLASYPNVVIGESSPVSIKKHSDLNRPSKRPACENCISKYHCAGGCYFNNLLYNEEQFNNYCKFMKTMVFQLIRYRLIKNDLH